MNSSDIFIFAEADRWHNVRNAALWDFVRAEIVQLERDAMTRVWKNRIPYRAHNLHPSTRALAAA